MSDTIATLDPDVTVQDNEALDDDYVLTAGFVEKVVDAADDGDGPRLRALLDGLHPADVADLMGFLTSEHRTVVVLGLSPDLLGETLPELDDGIREEVLERLPAGALAEALQELDSDDAAAVVEDLEDDQRERVLSAMPLVDRAAIENSLGYAEDTAGRLMQREVMAAPQFWTVGDTIDHVRAQHEELPELFFDIYVVDPSNKPVGGIPISWLLRAGRDIRLSDLMEPVNVIAVDQDQEEVAYIFEKYHLISAPVVDAAGRLVGQITVDDIVNIIQEENREDILRLAGVSDESRGAGVLGVVRSRIPWLIVNLGTAVFASLVIGQFQTEIETLVALAVLMPVVASIGGNAGTQALTVAVRSLAARELTSANAMRILTREIMVGLTNGVTIAVLMAAIAGVWFGLPKLSLTIGLAVLINLVAASLAGTLIPIILDRLDRDPAVASPVFVTWITDTVGFFSFLGLAGLILL
ncbi:magnesium transporter [Brevundimonas vitis]|uniref:Magnesium transporter MgtE n=1 Tax=Brevundimonas vitisensis TaxID=2800818 RepID=A0ABX7BNF7_9CAUL|nr:magnesium transporter [Brevundimonas vitisensis]QQQ18408.1 magnesium transporter [Brevundimonas vitisensis]